jgi:hypothetical protein
MKKFSYALVVILMLAGLTAMISSFNASAPAMTITVQMTGAQEAPTPGDPDGTGTAVLRLNVGKGTIDYTLTVQNIDAATAAHIHVAPPGQAGPVVVPLSAPTSGSVTGVATVAKDIILAIMKDPAAYYVNVHNATYPGGAVRGQLGKKNQ